MSEHDYEPIRGLPADLPAGERLLWQGAPDWRVLAQHVFHIRIVALYFAILFAWRGASAAAEGAAPLAALQASLWVAVAALAALALLAGLASIMARTSVYTITSKRVVLRFGIAIPKAINIPFAIIESAAVKSGARSEGDVALTLTAPNKIAYWLLWPHVRPWRLSNPEPSLRGLADAPGVAAILAAALREAQSRAATTPTPISPAPVSAPEPAIAAA